jgi:hypothetical protein
MIRTLRPRMPSQIHSVKRAAGSCTILRLEILEARNLLSFLPPVPLGTGVSPLVPVTGDFAGTGYDDIAVSNTGSGSISVFLSNGDCTFQPRQDYSNGSGALGLHTADLNGDAGRSSRQSSP